MNKIYEYNFRLNHKIYPMKVDSSRIIFAVIRYIYSFFNSFRIGIGHKF